MDIKIIREKKKILLKTGEKEVPVQGLHLFEFAKITTDKARFLEKKLNGFHLKRQALLEVYLNNVPEKILKDLHDEFIYYKNLLNRDFKTRELLKKNITTTIGRAVIAQRLAAINTYSGNVTHTALGDSPTAPSIADTLLGNEVYRKALSSGTSLNNISYLETFFTAAEVSGTFQEYANFIDGTGSVDTGQLFNRFTQAVVKSAVETLNVSSQITITDN